MNTSLNNFNKRNLDMTDQQQNLAHLLRKAQKGDQESLKTLCIALEKIVREYFRSKFNDLSIVDDLSQETHLRFLKNIPGIHEPMKLKNFILKVAFHVLQDFFRQKYRMEEHKMSIISEFGHRENTKLYHDAEASAVTEDVLSKMDIENALMSLPEKTRQILMMKAEGFKYDEIAEEFKLSVSGVKMQVKRGVEKLRISLFCVTFLVSKAIILIEKMN